MQLAGRNGLVEGLARSQEMRLADYLFQFSRTHSIGQGPELPIILTCEQIVGIGFHWNDCVCSGKASAVTMTTLLFRDSVTHDIHPFGRDKLEFIRVDCRIVL